MADSPSESNQQPGPPEQRPDPVVETISTWGKDQPTLGTMLFQLFVSQPASRKRSIQVPPEVVTKLIELDAARLEHQRHFRTQLLVFAGLCLLLLCAFVFGLVWLLRDHVEFTKEILAVVTLLVTHGAAVGGGFYAGRTRGRRRK